MQLTLGLLNRFVNELLGYYDYKAVKDTGITALIKLVDDKEEFWHIENDTIWRTKAWKQDEGRKERLRILAAQENELVQLRKDTLSLLTQAVKDFFSLDDQPEMAEIIAYKFLKKRNIAGAKMLGVDISSLPELPKPYIIITEKGGVIEL